MKTKFAPAASVAKGAAVIGGALLLAYGLSKCSEKVLVSALKTASTLVFK